MNIMNFIKQKYKVLIPVLLISSAACFPVYKSAGIKDTAMFYLATSILLIEIYFILYNKKMSLLLFIVSFPILVTARKFVYFNFLFFEIDYESIYITLIFISSFRSIKKYIKSQLMSNENSYQNSFLLLIAVLLLFATNSSIFSINIMDALGLTFISIWIPIMFALSILANFESGDKTYIYYALIVGVTFSSIYGFVQIITSGVTIKQLSDNRNLFTFGYHNVNIFACILTLIMPFIMELILYRRNNRKIKAFLYSSFIICVAALLFTFTRGAWLCFIVTIFIMVMSKKYSKIMYVLLAAFLVVAKPLIEFIINRGNATMSLFKNESAVARIHSFFTCITIIAKYPFGIGSGSFSQIYNDYAIKGYLLMPVNFRRSIDMANYALDSAHNLWLQICVELGIVCAVVFFLIVMNRIKLIFQNYKENRANFTAIVVYLIFSVLTGVEFNHIGVITHTLIIWLIFAMVNLSSKEGDNVEKYS